MPFSEQRTRPFALTLLLVTASGCPISPKYVRPEVPLTANWRDGKDPRLVNAATDVAWWKTFKDPVLERLIDLAYHQNLPLQIAGLRILEARAQLGIAWGQQLPSNPGAIGSVTMTGLNEHSASTGDIDLI